MNHPAPGYPFLAIREALQSLTGAGIAMLVICMIGGSVPTVASWTELPNTEECVLLMVAWVWHWVIAGLMFWGLAALLVPVWCFYELLHGTRSPFVALVVALISQLLVSTVAVCTVADQEEPVRAVIASGVAILVAVGALLWVYHVPRRRKAAQSGSRGIDLPPPRRSNSNQPGAHEAARGGGSFRPRYPKA